MVKTVDEYIGGFSLPVQKALQEIRAVIRECVPEAGEKMAYGIPTFTLNGNLVHYAAFEKHIGFYPAPEGIEAFKNEFGKYKYAKGSVQFPLDQPIPFDLIRRITLYRAEQNRQKK